MQKQSVQPRQYMLVKLTAPLKLNVTLQSSADSVTGMPNQMPG